MLVKVVMVVMVLKVPHVYIFHYGTSLCAECEQNTGAKYRGDVRGWQTSAALPGRINSA